MWMRGRSGSMGTNEIMKEVISRARERALADHPNRRAIATACVLLFASSFMLMLRRCVRTVLSDTNSFSAIAPFE